ncbi:unnamed protein product [Protopolystoma xenopodis]|uniref:Glutamyl/glutaminyl-tRNA synthetase class Ib catalytic domain-containing protein n=1 Tax=Protopolystoma xenopodis TaxID=117903 RepID=A0A3S5AKX2_9PLAT|nr:unnamed protein product [Protopolystoma xenopodis]
MYRDAVNYLVKNGNAYPCFCSSERLKAFAADKIKGEIVRYDQRCYYLSDTERNRLLDRGCPHVFRLKLENSDTEFEDLIQGSIRINLINSEGDPIILKSDGLPVYHLANVVDDHLMEITHVIRGVVRVAYFDSQASSALQGFWMDPTTLRPSSAYSIQRLV